jgi:hypothetical protein
MKTDRYTKTVLTVIAGALLYLCFAKNPPPVRADSAQRVIIVGEETRIPVPVTVTYKSGSDYYPVSKGSPLPVVNDR